MTGSSESDGFGQSASKVRVAAGVAATVAGIIVGLAVSGLGLVALLFAFYEPSSATVRLAAVGFALIVLGIACIVAGTRVCRWIVGATEGWRT